ncbi:hypothetical protein FB45DRAFT_730549 [Roridomyces roridus]|uniref:DUF6570 domain-containing protein n=1 Tax=Roridomyces roridus TaxID=1738132 RepID=A0AAD7CLH6_9AGAR|nr:hypothetical protein FB45DRAFT_730549 [Roridomyces roridus]
MIARCRSKCWIIQLRQENQDMHLASTQRGIKGHIIIYLQQPSKVAEILPPSVEEITSPVCVLFVGSAAPTAEWLRDHAKPLAVNAARVRAALKWLKIHNHLYKDVEINEDCLRHLEENPVLPFSIEHIQPNSANEASTARYDSTPAPSVGDDVSPSTQIPFQNVVITDVDGHASSNELRAAAFRHVKKGGGYIEVPHNRDAENEFRKDSLLFPMIYPTLFPYGIGGPEDSRREVPCSLKRHVKHLFNLADTRFQEHPSFLFTAFNIMQRRELLLHTSLKVKKVNFASVAAQFASVSPEVVQRVSERVAGGNSTAPKDAEELKVFNLLRQVNAVASSVPGSSAAVTIRFQKTSPE